MTKKTIAELRRAKGVTQSVVARRVGRELTTIRNWEKGRNLVKVVDAERICKVLGCNIEDIDWTREYYKKHRAKKV